MKNYAKNSKSKKVQHYEEEQQIDNLTAASPSIHSKAANKDDNQGVLANLINNPGLQHLAEEIFWNLNLIKALENCQQINQSSKMILQNPVFWLKKFVRRGLSKKNEEDWMKAIQLVKNSNKEKCVLSYLKWKNKKIVQGLVDLPCYNTPNAQQDFQKLIWRSFSEKKYKERLKIIAPLTVNPNAPDKIGNTVMYSAAFSGHAGIVKILAPFIENPNSPNELGETPIHRAAGKGHTDIVKMLVPLTDNPNASDCGRTPIYDAAKGGHSKIVKILLPFTDCPNAPGRTGVTPIYWAAYYGHTEIVKILSPLTDNPNGPPDQYKIFYR